MGRATSWSLLLAMVGGLAGCGEQVVPAPNTDGYTETRQPCARHNPFETREPRRIPGHRCSVSR